MTNVNIKLISIEDYGHMDGNKPVRMVHPRGSKYDFKLYYNFPEGTKEQILEAAKGFDGICVALVCNTLGEEFLYGCSEAKGCTSRPYFFNAAVCDAFEAEHAVATYNTGRGALTDYWWKRYLKFEKGGMA